MAGREPDAPRRVAIRAASRVLAVVTALLIWACGASSPADESDAADAADAAEAPDIVTAELPEASDAQCAAIGHLAPARQVDWPGGGARLSFRVTDGEGAPIDADLSRCLAFERDNAGQATVYGLRRGVPAPGHVLLALRPPASSKARDELEAAVSAFLATRPRGERVALYAWGANVSQIADFSRDRPRLEQMAARYLDEAEVAEPAAGMPAEAALPTLREVVARVGGPGDAGMRALVVLGAGLPGAPVIGSADAMQAEIWALEQPGGAVIPSAHLVTWEESGGAGGAMSEAAARLETLRQAAFYDVGVCYGGRAQSASLFAEAGGVELEIALDDTPEDARDEVCEPEAAAAGARPMTRLISFGFDEVQRAEYAKRLSANSKADFGLSVQIWPGGGWVEATAHLRGKGSLACGRRNYTLNLKGTRPRHLLPGAATDKYFLISMCRDDLYVNQYPTDLLMKRLDIFPIGIRLVELRVDGDAKGAYLLMEQPDDGLEVEMAGLRSVIRRGTDIKDGAVEVKFTHTTPEAALAEYEGILGAAEGLKGQALLDELLERMDLRGYFRWIGLMTLLHNGDYIDEIYFYATHSLGRDGGTAGYFGVMGWDPDDIFSTCHYGGAYAVEAPHGLLYCTESLLDHAILGDPVVFGFYVDVLEALIEEEASTAVVAEAFDRAVGELLGYLADPDVSSAMSEMLKKHPDAKDPNVAKAVVSEAAQEILEAVEAEREVLRAAIAAYRSEAGR